MNWGTKLIIAMILFMAFILTLSINMIYSSNDALIEKDYYEKGLDYDKTYAAKHNAIADSVLPVIATHEYGLSISFKAPAVCKFNFKRLSDQKMDTTFSRLTNEDFSVQVTSKELKSGPWSLTLDYKINNRAYLIEKKIVMP